MTTRKLTGVLALAGFVWVLGLCFSAPSATYWEFRGSDEGVTVKCEPLIDPDREPRDPDDLLTREQRLVVQKYREQEKQSDQYITDERLEQFEARAEQVIVKDCQSARLDRLANIGFIAFLTIVPTSIALRPGRAVRRTPA